MSQFDPYDLTKNVIIRACAGAGKTYTLTWRYLAILNDFAKDAVNLPPEKWQGPGNILAITFTNKAIAELHQRIRTTLTSIFNENEQNFELDLKYLKSASNKYRNWLMKELIHPHIMTLDAFCLMILKENPIKSGIDLGVSVPDNSDYNRMLSICFSKLFDSLTESDRNELIKSFSYYKIESIFRDALENQIYIENIFKRYEYSEDFIFQSWVDKYQPKLKIDSIMHEMQLLSEMIIYNKILPNNIVEVWQKWYEKCKFYFDQNKIQRPGFFKTKIYPDIITQSGTVKKSLGKTGGKLVCVKSGLNIDEFKRKHKELRNKIIDLPISDVEFIFTSDDRNHVQLIKKMLKHFKRFFSIVGAEKRKKRFITYSDMIRKSIELFKLNTFIPKDLNNRYPHLLIDEFQDINDIHWQIIKSISPDNKNFKERGLFIVGDEKQSIYRFNRADVTVFANAEIDLKKSKSFERVYGLNWNFRSSQTLINICINPLFELVLAPENIKTDNPFITRHQHTCQKDGYFKELPIVKKSDSVYPYQIDIFAYSKNNKDQFVKDKLAYPLHIAKKIKTILNMESIQELKLKGKPVIGVLLSAVKPVLDHYIEAFRLIDIDFEIPMRYSFYQSQEIMDIDMVLSIILNPNDDIAMCGLLRSPIFAFTDSEIHLFLNNDRNGKSVYECIDEFDASIKIKIDNWRELVLESPIDRVLEKIFNNECIKLGYYSEPDGLTRIQNIEKMIRIIHRWSLSGMSIESIRWKLRDEIENNNDEGADTLVSNPEVVIMSIHKSKGLSFPYVIIPEIQKTFFAENNNRFHLDFSVSLDAVRKMELGFTPRNDLWENKKYALTSKIRHQQRLELIEEKKRLLYVGVTRAEFGVILSGKIEEDNLNDRVDAKLDNCKSWMEWIRKIYKINSEFFQKTKSNQLENGPVINKTNWIPFNFKNKTKIEEQIYSQQKIVNNFQKYIQIGVTSLFPSERIKKRKVFSSNRNKGILIHKILEMGWLNSLNRNLEIKQWISKQSQSYKDSIVNIEIDSLFEVLDKNKTIISVNQADESFPELKINGYIQSQDESIILQVSGVIDVLYRKGESWLLLDYKTGSSSENINHYKKQIQMYMHLVRWSYGIKPEGKLIFIDDQISIDIPFDENFIENLKYRSIFGYQFIPDKKIKKYIRFENIILPENALIVVPSKIHVNKIWNFLVSKRKLKPNHKILTPSEILDSLHLNYRFPSDLACRISVEQIIKNSSLAGYVKHMEGVLSAIANAFKIYFYYGGNLKTEIKDFYHEWKNLLIDRGYDINFDYDKIPQKKLISDLNLIVDECALVNPYQKEILKLLNENSNSVQWIDTLGEIENKKPSNDHKYFDLENENIYVFKLMDVRNEVRYIGTQILKEVDNGTSLMDIGIILPSMEIYLPLISGEFKQNGIPLQIRKSEPLFERSIVKTLFSLIKIIISINVEWRTIKSVLEHPLCIKVYPELKVINKTDIYKIDIEIRKYGFKKWNKIVKYYNYQNSFSENSIKVLDTIDRWVSRQHRLSIGNFNDNLIQVLNKWNNHNYILSSDEKKAYETFRDSFEELDQELRQWEVKLIPSKFLRELENLISLKEFSSSKSSFGVEVLSISDSIYPNKKFIYVPGMTQQGFPVKQKSNPFISNVPDVHYPENLKIFNSWVTYSENLILTFPDKDNNGKYGLPSICIENIQIENIQEIIDFESDQKIKNTIGKVIKTDSNEQLLLKQIDRHNDFIKNPIPSKYYGEINYSCHDLKNDVTSATALDELHVKPLYFLIKRGWGISEIDKNRSIYLDKGLFVHEVLEKFGNADGWDLNRKNSEKGKAQLMEIVEKVLTKWTKRNPESKYALSEINLSSPTIWEFILKEDSEFYPDFIHIKSEQEFGKEKEDSFPPFVLNHPQLGDIIFNGSIDRFDKSINNKIIIAQDYKSGQIKWDKDLIEMQRQLFIYALILKQQFPNSKIGIGYRKVNSIKNQEWGFHKSFIIEDDPSAYSGININSGKNHLKFDSYKEMKQLIISSFNPIISGMFKPFETSNQSLKEYYYLKSISRLETIKYHLKN